MAETKPHSWQRQKHNRLSRIIVVLLIPATRSSIIRETFISNSKNRIKKTHIGVKNDDAVGLYIHIPYCQQ